MNGNVSEAVYRTVDKRGHFAAPSQPRSMAGSPCWGKACATGRGQGSRPQLSAPGAAAVVPPTVLPLAPLSIATPAPPLGRAVWPAASVPM